MRTTHPQAAAGRANAVELTDVVSVLPYAPYAYPHDGEATATVLSAVKVRPPLMAVGVPDSAVPWVAL